MSSFKFTRAEYLGLHAVGWDLMTSTWYEKVLAALLLAAIVLGSAYLLVLGVQTARKHWKNRRQISTLPRLLVNYFDNLRLKETRHISIAVEKAAAPKSFTVFLGSFENPPTPAQSRILSHRGLVVLDPFQEGIIQAVQSSEASNVIARLNLETILGSTSNGSAAEIVISLDKFLQAVRTVVRPEASIFKGVLISSWHTHFLPVVFNELISHVIRLGLDVYLEVSAPEYLSEKESSELNLDVVAGIVMRNATILEDGERRDYWQMDGVRRAFRSFSAQSTMSGGAVILWETINNNVQLDHAVAKRSYIWCRFNSAMNWIGTESALVDADIATVKTLANDPLGALMWLKEDENMKAHDIWRMNDRICKEQTGDNTLYDTLDSFVPHLAEKLALLPAHEPLAEIPAALSSSFDWSAPLHVASTNPFSSSSRGYEYGSLGCFQLGLECTADDFEDLTAQQIRLRDLNMLDRIKPAELRRMGEQLQQACNNRDFLRLSSPVSDAIKDLVTLLVTSNGDDNDLIKMYIGLHSGFHKTIDQWFWGLYNVDESTNSTSIFISAKSNDRIGALLHTFMSSRGCTRTQCFQAEIALAAANKTLSQTWQLPQRFVEDIEALTPAEGLLFVQRLALSQHEDSSILIDRVRSCIEYQLMEVPSLKQLRALNAESYLSGSLSAQDLVKARLDWYHEKGCQAPAFYSAVALFSEVDTRVAQILMAGDSTTLAQIGEVFCALMVKGQIDARADMFSLAVVCAIRKLAFNEVYLEILDRNPMPNEHSDQAACFAEMFALGSRCDSYFDTTPDALGGILAAKYRLYFKDHQPPMRDDASTELPTTYASKQTDSDADAKPLEIPAYYQVSFLGIFALPALVDILLLTTIGRGLYLTAYMSNIEKNMATTALMVSLLLCGSIGTWISSGGSYYLHSMAFPAMNMFVLTRYTAGITVCLAGGIIAFFAIGATQGWYAGVLFFLYLVLLTTYLLTLASLAIYQIPGFSFQSGRIIIMFCIPILLLSPVITLWVGHDIVVYLCVLVGFLMCLIFGLRRTMSQWATWYLRVPCISDTEVVNWYTANRAAELASYSLGESADLAATPLPRRALTAAVLKERSRRFWQKGTSDEFVLRQAKGFATSKFLMDWYCKYSRTNMPYAFSPTWNLQCKAAVQTLRDTQKGLKLHNAFVHWRHSSDEVWCGILYFVIALMDKWVSLISGSSLVGLSDAGSERFRLSVGFGLAYYLIGALCLDAVAQPLWALANKAIPQPITSLAFLRQAAIDNARAKRQLYWKSLGKFFFVHIWGMCITATLMWTFEGNSEAAIMFLAYVVAYTGLLWYQYNRIFTGPVAFKNLLIAAVLGLVVGPVIHDFYPHFHFNAVIALAVATWSSAIMSLFTAKVGQPNFKDEQAIIVKDTAVFFSNGGSSPGTPLSQATLAQIYRATTALPEDDRYRLEPSAHPGAEVLDILYNLSSRKQSKHAHDAFRSATDIISQSADYWKNGKMIIDMVPARHLLQQQHKLRSVSKLDDEKLHLLVFVGPDYIDGGWVTDIHRNCQVTAEAIIQVNAEARFGISHEHSALAELLVLNHVNEQLAIPEGVKRQIENSTSECFNIIQASDRTLLRQSLLGLDCDIDWDLLPSKIRSFLLKRSCGELYSVSQEQLSWVSSKFCAGDLSSVQEYVARCNLAVDMTLRTTDFAAAQPDDVLSLRADPSESEFGSCISLIAPTIIDDSKKTVFGRLFHSAWNFLYALRTCVKFAVISLVADSEYQRELDFLLSGKSCIIHWPVTYILNSIWVACKGMQSIVLPMFLFHDRERISEVHSAMKGTKTIFQKRRILIGDLKGSSTCFIAPQADGTSTLHQYSGDHQDQPDTTAQLIAVNTYSDTHQLKKRDVYVKEAIVGSFEYEYQTSTAKYAMQRRTIAGAQAGRKVQYDERGFIFSSSHIQDESLVETTYFYRKHAKFDDELLTATYLFPEVSIKVSWAARPRKHIERLDEWVPHTKILEAVFMMHEGEKIYKASWSYDHKFHPEITTTLDGVEVATPAMIKWDWYKVFTKPTDVSFQKDDPLLGCRSVGRNFASRLLRLNVRRNPISTAAARTYLWQVWKKGTDIDAVTARWLDENALRSEKYLKPYWAARDLGRLKSAETYLNSQVDNIVTKVDLEHEISQWALTAFKISDLYSFGQGGDARINTRDQTTQMRDSDTRLHVLAMDTGTWPMESGGVSACRRDMVDNLDTIKWHVLAESANDFGVPRFQIQKNVQSLTVLPLWGLDFLTPTHGVFESSLDSAVQQRSQDTSDADILANFIPILTTLVRCSRAKHLSQHHLEEAGKALIDLNNYFTESARHWSVVWTSKIVKRAWQELWLSEDADNCRPITQWLDAEKPTLQHLDNALDMWHRYLFIFSVPVPEEIPDVVQASHHFAGASYGVLLKLKRNSTLHVWDHCISWREVTVFLSSAMSFDPPFVCTSLMSLSKLACSLILHHADVVLPCADFFNPGWEVELGTIQGTLEHRKRYKRKIDPVVNGICNMERFKPIETIKSKRPTVTMLSHVRFVKDIKVAVLAADMIVNEWHFKDYQLEIWGDMEKAPAYSVECQEIIASKGLRDNVTLKGLGNPNKVLEDAWIFLNSSVSEGLPLAMGEAALTGVPVVCTDVGASFRVVTDMATMKRFSAVVAPNDALSLARAQIDVLALLGEWSEYADDAPGPRAKMPLSPTPEQAKEITQRMWDKTEQRRRLGMMGRTNVLNSFSSDRYLREHEQMLWIGKYQSKSYQAKLKRPSSYASSSTNASLKEKKHWFSSEKSKSARVSTKAIPSGQSSIFEISESSNPSRISTPRLGPVSRRLGTGLWNSQNFSLSNK